MRKTENIISPLQSEAEGAEDEKPGPCKKIQHSDKLHGPKAKNVREWCIKTITRGEKGQALIRRKLQELKQMESDLVAAKGTYHCESTGKPKRMKASINPTTGIIVANVGVF